MLYVINCLPKYLFYYTVDEFFKFDLEMSPEIYANFSYVMTR